MEYIYAGMLLHKAGKQITAEAVRKVLEAAGVQVDEGRVKALVAALEGVDIDAAVKEASVVSAPAAVPVAASAEKKEEKKAEEKKVTEEQAAAGLGALFG